MIPFFDDISRKRITRLVFGWLLLVMLYQWWANLMISQLESPVLLRVDLDLTYWFVHLSGVGELFRSSYSSALTFDILLTVLCLITALFPKRTIFPIVTGVLYLIYCVLLNSYQCWHYHNLITLILLIIPFCFRSLKTFSMLFAGLRYAVAYVYASAAIWKLFRGSVFNEGQMQWLIEHNYVDRLAVEGYQLNFLENTMFQLSNYPTLSSIALIVGIAMEASFLVAFFTRKFDRYLIIIGVVFHLITAVLVDVSFLQLWILFLVFIPPNRIMSSPLTWLQRHSA
ncbi:MAG: hypothetical protein P8P74_07060 [Crocinitomicaceae bacterium]|nr:hypothetical protein [Crocinitomicaceae bacterium]